MRLLENHWYRSTHTWLTFLLLPLSWLFGFLIKLRYFFYRYKLKKIFYFSQPIIVVGNITVGGTGKTPFVIWLAEELMRQGYQPGIVSRGIGGKKHSVPYWVSADSTPVNAGDEAVLLYKRTQCPVVLCIDRVAAAREITQKTTCNIIISDDGLQHYRLGRHLEIVLVDGSRQFGNGKLLPAGPLRESPKRLRDVDLVVVNGTQMRLQGDTFVSLKNPAEKKSLEHFRKQTFHAIAGIGNPERFFNFLRDQQIKIIEHIFPDHHLYQPNEIYFADNLPVIMTEKDAVKCFDFADDRHWYLPVETVLDSETQEKIKISSQKIFKK